MPEDDIASPPEASASCLACRWGPAVGFAALGLSLAASVFFLSSDLLLGRHALSTKDGRFQQEIRCRESGWERCVRLP